MNNPLLEENILPPFSAIKPEHVEPAITGLIEDNLKAIQELLATAKEYTWDNLIAPLEDLDDRLSRAWSPVGHLNAVVNSEELRAAYNACLPKLSHYATELGQNETLYRAYHSIAESDGFASLDPAQKKIISNALRDFKLSGVTLEAEKKSRYKEIAQELSSLSSKFDENVLDATQAWTKRIDNEEALAGLPDSAKNLARQSAQSRNMEGWVLTLEFPSYLAVMTFADDRALRREVYEAFATRASDRGPGKGQWDNSDNMEAILRLRHEKAQLLGFDNYAELSLATKMAKSPEQVIEFLEDLARKSLPVARRDLEELTDFAKNEHSLEKLEVWDIPYYSEKMRQHRYMLSQEVVRGYFPATRVVPGLFGVVERLYGIRISEKQGVDTWHPDVRYFEITDLNDQFRGSFYLDLYARTNKRGGAWMDECVTRKRTRDAVQHPVAYLTCNFTPPVGQDPALLTHDEVITLFHEFGHGLHHLLTQVDHLGVSGIHGVEWDAVELPSQFMENWCWEREALDLISGHYQTGEKLPDDLFKNMLEAKNFQSGMMMVRQLEFALFDFLIHAHYSPAAGGRIYATLDEVRKRVAVVIPPEFNRFAHSFSHIFAGGYGAGYYSYKWAEVLSADAFSLFEDKGIFDRETGESFLHHVLEQGGSHDAMELFVAFRGREPEIDALLRHNGIAA
ncbi:MAG: oligopeptidase A [Gammaproteobacteria bacterium]